MVKDSKYTENKELLIVSGATHTDLYDQKRILFLLIRLKALWEKIWNSMKYKKTRKLTSNEVGFFLSCRCSVHISYFPILS